MATKDIKLRISELYKLIFDHPNPIIGIPIIFIVPLSVFLVSLLFIDVVQLLPREINDFVIVTELSIIGVPASAIIATIILWLLYRNSIFFRFSLYMNFTMAFIVMLVFAIIIDGSTVHSYALYMAPIFLTIVMMIIYTINSVKKPVETIRDEIKSVANGDFVARELNLSIYGKEFADLGRAIKGMTDQLQVMISAITNASNQLASSSEEMAASVEQVNSSSMEISNIIQQMNRGAQKQAEQINDTVINVQELSDMSIKIIEDINNTIGIISDVANQTNMLSLNAQIEAARAGDFGKSFMVVADNVRRLAEDTKVSTGNIEKLVENIQHQISSNVDRIAKSVDSVAVVAVETVASSEEVSAATEEQTATMEELSAFSQELARLSGELNNQVMFFRLKEDQE
ncbi:MAG: methyl-accepting chemotaxis protein [Candidatus Hodarchaeales archaeon]